MKASIASSVLLISLPFLFILNFVNVANGATAYEEITLVKNAKYCVVDGKEHLVNRKWTGEYCEEMICTPGEVKNKGFRFINTCPKIIPGENCVITEGDLSKEYPDCCPGIKCSGDH